MCEYVHTPEVPLRKSRACERMECAGNTSPRVSGATAAKDAHGPRQRGRPVGVRLPRPAQRAAPRRGLPQEHLRPCPWPVSNTSGELIENKFRS